MNNKYIFRPCTYAVYNPKAEEVFRILPDGTFKFAEWRDGMTAEQLADVLFKAAQAVAQVAR